MKTGDKSTDVNVIAHRDLRHLSSDQLQELLDTYFAQHEDATARQLVRELLHELQAHQIELEMQNRDLLESQTQLEEARDRYADLYDFAPVSYLTFDATGCIHEINQTGASLLGQEQEQLLGKPFHQWLVGASGRVFFTHLKTARLSGQVETIELRLQPHKGTPRSVRLESIVSPARIDGKPSYRCIVIDITASRQAEREIQHQGRQLRLLSDAMPTFIGYVNTLQRHEFVNKVYEEWFQMPRERIVGKTVKELIGEISYVELEPYIRSALAGNTVNFEVAYPPGGRDERLFNVSYIPDFDDDGTVLGYFTLGQDVTELRKHEQLERMQLLEMARVARINTMGEMVAELAHELNQPLAAISIYSDTVSRMLNKQSPDIQNLQKALNEIRLQAGRAGDVIIRLREFVSKRELQSETLQINTLVEEVMKLIAVEARWHGVKIELLLGRDIPPISADRILLEQVVLNLARNAIEAMDAIDHDKRKLLIRTAPGTYNEIELLVEDNGPGMSSDDMEKVFEPFYTSKEHGMGMGLAISRSIIKAHHGRLWAIPNEYGGTTFTFTLPYETEDEKK